MHLLLLVLVKFYFVAALKPVVLMPGLIGSQLHERINSAESDNIDICSESPRWSSLWLNIIKLQINQKLFFEHLKLEINENGTTRNRKGVEIQCPKFGDTFAVEHLGPYFKKFLVYFADFVDQLVKIKGAGYKRDKNIRGAPYDFRKAPNEMAKYLDDLTKLIEDTYKENGQKRVVMLGHSMGCLYTLYLLNNKDQAWKDKYVEAFIALGAPWHGAVQPMRVIASGDDLGLNKYKPLINIDVPKFRDAAQTMPSASWLMPSSVAWNSTEILVMGPKRNYTVNDYENFFNDINFKNGMLLRRNTENLTRSLEYPGVKIYCIYSLIPNSTADSFDYRGSKKNPWYDEQPRIINGDGDRLVNLRSLEACKDWPNTIVQKFDGVDHRSMMKNEAIQKYIINILNQLNSG